MPKTIADLGTRNKEIVESMEAMLKKIEEEERDLTDEEKAEYDTLEQELEKNDAEMKEIREQEARKERLEAAKGKLDQPANHQFGKPPVTVDPNKKDDREFSNLGEFMLAVYETGQGKRDKRLDSLYDTREQTFADGSKGGFLVPAQFSQELLKVDPPNAAFRPRARVIPAGSPPDASITMPALDQGSNQNNYGGVDVTWIGEGDAKPETDANFREITLTPHEVAATIIATDKLLRNWTASSATLAALLRQAIVSAEETAFLNGNGVGKPLGVLNSNATISQSRATASTIAVADVIAMYARMKMGGNFVWLASQTVIPQLLTLTDGTNYIYQASAVPGIPPTLYGIPILYHDRMPGLGTTGDLLLVDLSYYLIKDGSGPFVAMSEHVYFTQNKTVIKTFWNVDGQPWLDEPLVLEGSTSDTVSPFVALSS